MVAAIVRRYGQKRRSGVDWLTAGQEGPGEVVLEPLTADRMQGLHMILRARFIRPDSDVAVHLEIVSPLYGFEARSPLPDLLGGAGMMVMMMMRSTGSVGGSHAKQTGDVNENQVAQPGTRASRWMAVVNVENEDRYAD